MTKFPQFHGPQIRRQKDGPLGKAASEAAESTELDQDSEYVKTFVLYKENLYGPKTMVQKREGPKESVKAD